MLWMNLVWHLSYTRRMLQVHECADLLDTAGTPDHVLKRNVAPANPSLLTCTIGDTMGTMSNRNIYETAFHGVEPSADV